VVDVVTQRGQIKNHGNVLIIWHLKMVWIEMVMVSKNTNVKLPHHQEGDVAIKQRIKIKDVMHINKCVIIIV
jgi:hypothetical protein